VSLPRTKPTAWETQRGREEKAKQENKADRHMQQTFKTSFCRYEKQCTLPT
jgi:hypothetical protein